MRRIILSSAACLSLLYHIFPHYLFNGTISGKKLLSVNFVLIFSKSLFETILILRSIERDIIINVLRRSCKILVILYSSQILMKLELSRQIFEEFSSIKIRKPSSESRIVNVDEVADIRNNTKSLFRNFAKATSSNCFPIHI
jgi:hypothetical protein